MGNVHFSPLALQQGLSSSRPAAFHGDRKAIHSATGLVFYHVVASSRDAVNLCLFMCFSFNICILRGKRWIASYKRRVRGCAALRLNVLRSVCGKAKSCPSKNSELSNFKSKKQTNVPHIWLSMAIATAQGKAVESRVQKRRRTMHDNTWQSLTAHPPPLPPDPATQSLFWCIEQGISFA